MHIQKDSETPPEIFIVHTHTEYVRRVTSLLKPQGYRVRVFCEGDAAVPAVLDSPPDLIILGGMLSDMDGYELCRQLKTEPRSRDIPVLFLCASNDAAENAKIFDAGGSDYLTTPIQEAELLARVNTHLALSRLQSRFEETLEKRTTVLRQKITDDKEVETALRESEHNLLRSHRIANLGGWEYDLRTRTLTLSPEFDRIFGLETQEENVSYETFLSTVHPDDIKCLRTAYRQAIHGDHPYDGIHRIIRPSDGEIRHLHERCEHITDEDGRVVRIIGILQDVTDHERAKYQLEQERLRYKTLLGIYHDGIVILNKEHKVVEANERFADMLGYTSEEVLNLHTWDWEAVATKAELIENFPKSLPFNLMVETRHRRKDGTVFDVEVSASWEVVDGEVLGLCICRDITERKCMEMALEKETRRRKALMSGYHDGIVIISVSQDHKVIEANRRFSEMLGYTREEVLNMHTWDWEAVLTKSEIRANFTEGALPDTVFETRHRRKDGTVYDVELTAYGEIVAGEALVLCICRDITERKRMEQALEKETRRRKTLMSGYRDGIVMINASQNHKVVEANRRFAEMLGYTPEEVLDLHSWDWEAVMTAPEIRDQFPVGIPYSAAFETRHRRKDGTVFDVEVSPYGEMVDGEELVLCICRDITERKRAEEELRQYREHLEEVVQKRTAELTLSNEQLRQEIVERKRVEAELRQAKDAAEDAQRAAETAQRNAEAANRLKAEFLANMSHEIRTPLNAVLGFAGVLEPDLTDPQQQQYLRLIEAGARSLLALMNDILDLAKIESGVLEIHPEPVDLEKLIAHVMSLFKADVARKALDLQIHIAPDLPRELLLDELRLRQILFNLLGNAVKFTEKGTVTLEVTHTAQDEDDGVEPQKFALMFIISDTGIGIPYGQQQLIFDAFRQLDGRKTRRYGGTGLGLALAKRLVDMMGGTISLTSEVGKGSCFEVTLQQVPVPDGTPPEGKQHCLERDVSGSRAARMPFSPVFLRTLLQELAPLVEKGDLDALQYLEQLRSLFGGMPFEEIFRLLEAQLLHYDFEKARTTLATLTRKLRAFENTPG